MTFDLMRTAKVLQRTVPATSSGHEANQHQQALALVGRSDCRSLYTLKNMDFSNLTRSQNFELAFKLLARSERWLGTLRNKTPTITNYLELRFYVDAFIKMADECGLLSFLTPISVQSNPRAADIQKTIEQLKAQLRGVKSLLDTQYVPRIDLLLRILESIAKSPYLVTGWSWLAASDGKIKNNLAHCK